MDFEIIQPGPGRLIRALMDEIKIIPTINAMVSWDQKQWNLSPGELIAAIIISCFCRRQALYRLADFYQHQDLELLFGRSDIRAEDFTDDSLGRALDRLADASGDKLLGTVVMNARNIHHFTDEILHADTTSVTVYGEYNFPDEEEPLIALGFSKAHRPDLKQYMIGLMVTSEGIPIYGKTLNGNTSDNTWNKELFQQFRAGLTDYLNSIIVADSKAITTDNLKSLNGLKFISRFPETYKLCEELKRRAWQENHWTEAGQLALAKKSASYQVQEFSDQINGKTYRFVVVHSSSLDKAKEKSVQREIRHELEMIEKGISRLTKIQFACEPDARQEWERFIKTTNLKYHTLEMNLVREEIPEKRTKRGRPRTDDEPTGLQTVYRLVVEPPVLDQEAVKTTYDLARTFVLISSVPADSADEVTLLKHYKGQIRIENRFKFLKDPYYVGPVFLKKPERIRAFNYVMLLALLLYSLLERRVRQGLARENEPLPIAGSYKTFRPSGKTILEFLDYLTIGIFHGPNGSRREIPANIRNSLGRLVRLTGFEIDIYTIPPNFTLDNG